MKKNQRKRGNKSAEAEYIRSKAKDLMGNFKKHYMSLITFKRKVSMIYTAKFVTIKNIRVFLPYFRSKIVSFSDIQIIKITLYLAIQVSLNTFLIHL